MRLLFILISLFSVLHSKHCYFLPPSGWEIAQLKTPSPHVKVGFLGKGSTEFRPSINLAVETVDLSLKQYIKAVKELQKEEGNTTWRDLGRLQMQGGTGHLTEMTRPTPYGEVKILQAFLVNEGAAYILTGAVLKKDFPEFQGELLKSFRSLNITTALSDPITNGDQRKKFEQLFQSLGSTEEKEKEWGELKKEILSYPELGAYWQFVVLQEGRDKIYTPWSIE